MQAAVGVTQLRKLDAFCTARRENWRFYRDAFDGLQDVLVLPEATEGADPSWFGFFMVVREDAPFTRDEVVRHLESKKIQTRMLFAGNLVRQPALTNGDAVFRVAGDLTVTDTLMNRGLWVGVYPGLTEPMRDFVASELHHFVRH